MSAQNTDYLTFFLPLNPFPHAQDYSASLSHKYLKHLAFGEVDLRLVFPSPCLAALWMNSFSAPNLRVSAFGLLCVGQTSLVQ